MHGSGNPQHPQKALKLSEGPGPHGKLFRSAWVLWVGPLWCLVATSLCVRMCRQGLMGF